MAMEHRWSERKPLNLEVTLNYPPIGLIDGKTRDVSLEGMFVDTGGVPLPQHAEVEVNFCTRTHGQVREHCVPAYVVHGRHGGIGLMLRHVAYQDFHALRSALQAA